MMGHRSEVRESFDKRQNAKAANDGSSAEASAQGDDDMFTRAGVAAE